MSDPTRDLLTRFAGLNAPPPATIAGRLGNVMYWLGNSVLLFLLSVSCLWGVMVVGAHAMNHFFGVTFSSPLMRTSIDDAALLVIWAANVSVATWLPCRAAAYVLRGH